MGVIRAKKHIEQRIDTLRDCLRICESLDFDEVVPELPDQWRMQLRELEMVWEELTAADD